MALFTEQNLGSCTAFSNELSTLDAAALFFVLLARKVYGIALSLRGAAVKVNLLALLGRRLLTRNLLAPCFGVLKSKDASLAFFFLLAAVDFPVLATSFVRDLLANLLL